LGPGGGGGAQCTGLIGFTWIGETLERFAHFPAVGAYAGLFVFSAWTAVPFGLWAIGVAKGPQRGWAAYVWPVALWVGANALWPSLFPYTPMIGLSQTPAWIQAAELGGVPLVEAQTIIVGILIADAALETSPRRRMMKAAIGVAIPIVSYGLGAWRIAQIDAEAAQARTVRFGILQPNTALMATTRPEKMRRLWYHSAQAQAEGAQVIVWPEAGIYPFVIERPWEHDKAGPRRVLFAHKLPTILGVATRARRDRYEWNSVVIINAEGDVTGTFDKNVLVPFGEYIPIVDPDWARSYIPAMSHNHAGEEPARFTVELTDGSPDVFAGPLICYEDIFPDFAHEVARQEGGIDVFVNVTIDTWFGDTAEPWEHLALAQYRSVEHRVPMVRSVAAGTSSVVDTAGRVAAALPVRAPTDTEPVPAERLVVDVKLPRNTAQAPTIFARFGWMLRWLCSFAALLVPVALLVRNWLVRKRFVASPAGRRNVV
jgi:apolipoprotein N-acyltransferase